MIQASYLMCHAPIVIPEIGGDRASLCESTTKSMRSAAKDLVHENPETVIVVSPHTPRHPNHFGLQIGDHLSGSFSQFGFDGVKCNFTLDASLTQKLANNGQSLINLSRLDGIDHGAAVPLFFLQEAGYQGKIVLVSLPMSPNTELNRQLGEVISEVSSETKLTILASGDMSHRLQSDAPAGYHPKAKNFDDSVTNAVESGKYSKIHEIDPTLRENAAEDVIDSLEIAFSATRYDNTNAKFYSYEGPFGVGYLVARLNSLC